METTVRLRELVLRDKPQEMLELSPKGTVPVLELTNGTVIDESRDVMVWALEQNDPENWLRAKNFALIDEADGDFKHHLDRYKYATRYKDVDPSEHREAGFAFIQKLNEHITANGFLVDNARSFADIAIFPFIRQFRIADQDWFDTNAPAALRQWLATLMDSPLFTGVMKKYPTWKESGEEFLFSGG